MPNDIEDGIADAIIALTFLTRLGISLPMKGARKLNAALSLDSGQDVDQNWYFHAYDPEFKPAPKDNSTFQLAPEIETAVPRQPAPKPAATARRKNFDE